MHADRPGDRPRLLYWYRTAPGIVLGRPPLDEDAIRTIEEQHPDIDFDWPAILALAEVMTPEDEAPAAARKPRKGRDSREPREQREQRESRRGRDGARDAAPVEGIEHQGADEPTRTGHQPVEPVEPLEPEQPVESRNRLVEELAGREIGSRLRARHAEIISRIEEADIDGAAKGALFKRAEAIDPELWMTPEQVLEGVRNADAQYEKLKSEI